MQIDVYMDHVIIEGQRVNRPWTINRSVWMYFWEAMSYRTR